MIKRNIINLFKDLVYKKECYIIKKGFERRLSLNLDFTKEMTLDEIRTEASKCVLILSEVDFYREKAKDLRDLCFGSLVYMKKMIKLFDFENITNIAMVEGSTLKDWRLDDDDDAWLLSIYGLDIPIYFERIDWSIPKSISELYMESIESSLWFFFCVSGGNVYIENHAKDVPGNDKAKLAEKIEWEKIFDNISQTGAQITTKEAMEIAEKIYQVRNVSMTRTSDIETIPGSAPGNTYKRVLITCKEIDDMFSQLCIKMEMAFLIAEFYKRHKLKRPISAFELAKIMMDIEYTTLLFTGDVYDDNKSKESDDIIDSFDNFDSGKEIIFTMDPIEAIGNGYIPIEYSSKKEFINTSSNNIGSYIREIYIFKCKALNLSIIQLKSVKNLLGKVFSDLKNDDIETWLNAVIIVSDLIIQELLDKRSDGITFNNVLKKELSKINIKL
jgi:hypothetical protein